MSEYDNSNRGAIWNNDQKKTDRHPDYSGSINVDGKEYWLSGWKKKPGQSDRAPLMSFSVRPKDYNDPQPTQTAKPAVDVDSEIPW